MTSKLKKLIWTAAIVLGISSVQAQDFPNKDIRFIVPYPGGGITDLVGRVMAEGLSAQLDGATIVVENKEGGTGIIGMTEVVKSKSDGYTLLVGGLGGQVIPPYVNPNFPFDPHRDFVPLSKVAELVNVMVVNKDMKVNSVQEFIAYAKEHPGELNFGSSGIGATNHLAASIFMQETGIDMVHVPYKGGGEAVLDLRAGVIDLLFENLPTVLGTIEAGEVKALAVTSAERSAKLPDIPTIAESGVEGFNVASWMMMFAPEGTPSGIVSKIGDAFAAAVQTPEVQEKLQKLGFEPVGTSASDAAAFYNSELARWGAFFKTQKQLEMKQ